MNRLSRALAVVLAAAGLAACGGSSGKDDPGASFTLRGDGVSKDPAVDADFVIDYGALPVGTRPTLELAIVNATAERLTIAIDHEDLVGTPFSISSGALQIGPKESRPLEVRFAPEEEGAFEATLTLRAGGGGDARTVRLLGAAAPLHCEPVALDLGHVVLGESQSGTVSCENPLDAPVELLLGSFEAASRPGFSASFAGQGGTAEIPAGGSVEIEIAYSAVDQAGEVSAELPVRDAQGAELLRIEVAAIAIESPMQLLREDAQGALTPLLGCLEFPPTGLGHAAEEGLVLRNLGKRALSLPALPLEGDAAHFAVVSPALDGPLVLEPGDEAAVLLRYEPRTSERHEASLRVEATASDGTPEAIDACLRGASDFPSLVCEPAALDFGPVAVGTEVMRSAHCSIQMIGPGSETRRVSIERVDSDDGQFGATVRGGAAAQGYAVGEAFWVDLSYAPASAAAHAATITLTNSTTGSPALPIEALGVGRNLAPCAFEHEPQALDFGVVELGEERTLTAYLVNTSTQHECIISNLRLGEGSDPALALEPVASAILPPAPPAGAPPEGLTTDHRYPIRVRFAPTEARVHEGSVDFFLSHPQQTAQRVDLIGEGGTPCLFVDVEHEALFSAGLQCASKAARLSIANFCADDATVEAIAIDPAYPQFRLEDLPTLPASLEAGERLEFAASLDPDLHGAFEGAVRVEVGRGAALETLVAPLQGTSLAASHADAFAPLAIDVLWVVDNSGGMTVEQRAIGARAQAFLSAAGGADYQLGITTTGVAYTGDAACEETGFEGAEDGRLVPHPDLGRPRILRAGTLPSQQLHEAFAQNVEVGWCAASEAVYEAARRAISAPWVALPEDQGGNRGFLRRGADLAIIGVTDEDDHDSLWRGDVGRDNSVRRYVAYFQDRKPSWRRDGVRVHMISGGTSECSSAMNAASACPRCVEGADRTGGRWVSICQGSEPLWDAAIEALSEAVFARGSRFPLRAFPEDLDGDGSIDAEDFVVVVGGQPWPSVRPTGARVWSYEAAENVIVFEPSFVPPAHQPVEIRYEVGCRP